MKSHEFHLAAKKQSEQQHSVHSYILMLKMESNKRKSYHVSYIVVYIYVNVKYFCAAAASTIFFLFHLHISPYFTIIFTIFHILCRISA